MNTRNVGAPVSFLLVAALLGAPTGGALGAPANVAPPAGNIQSVLESDPATAKLKITAAVAGDGVTLRGTVDSFPEKRVAEWVVATQTGVSEIRNEITVAPPTRPDAEIQRQLSLHFAQSPRFFSDKINVTVTDGRVRLSGQINNKFEEAWAREDAWVLGVREVQTSDLAVVRRTSDRGTAEG